MDSMHLDLSRTVSELNKVAAGFERDSDEDGMIFISHSSADVDVAYMLRDFLVSAGIPNDFIFCSSIPGNDVQQKISAEVKQALHISVVNIAILSESYYKSAYCLNEAGVFWFCDDDIPVIPILLPEIRSSGMRGFLDREYRQRRLDKKTDILEIYDTVMEAFGSIDRTGSAILDQASEKLIHEYTAWVESGGNVSDG